MSPLDDTAYVDTVIVGGGPSALILSFILHGNIPYYDLHHPHPDTFLDAKLRRSPCLLDADVLDLTAHFDGSRLSYSTQALPVNVLLDTLLRPLADVEPGERSPALVWKSEPERCVQHLVIGKTNHAGGQWASNPVSASLEIGTLSYANQLSLPGYSLEDYLGEFPKCSLSLCERPTRRQIRDYLAAYPGKVGISDSLKLDSTVSSVSRVPDGFYIASHKLRCRHLVLASGTFDIMIPPPEMLAPLRLEEVEGQLDSRKPILVIGSGFTAADVIISNVWKRNILHIFRWMPEERPSPLQACHPQAYPEYSYVYQRMKMAASEQLEDSSPRSPTHRKSKHFTDKSDWADRYEGLPNSVISDVHMSDNGAIIRLQLHNGTRIDREISGLAYVVGRRGSLAYLASDLLDSVIENEAESNFLDTDDIGSAGQSISGRTLREKVEVTNEIAPNLFAIGSLTGDSLIRFAYGGCVLAASKIFSDRSKIDMALAKPPCSPKSSLGEESAAKRICHCASGHEDLSRAKGKRTTPFAKFPRNGTCVLL